MNIYVGNLPNSTTETELTGIFKEYGEIHSLKIITDRESGRSRGFGFIEMEDSAAKKAIEELNDAEYDGRKLTVNQANERIREDRGNRRSNNNYNRRF